MSRRVPRADLIPPPRVSPRVLPRPRLPGGARVVRRDHDPFCPQPPSRPPPGRARDHAAVRAARTPPVPERHRARGRFVGVGRDRHGLPRRRNAAQRRRGGGQAAEGIFLVRLARRRRDADDVGLGRPHPAAGRRRDDPDPAIAGRGRPRPVAGQSRPGVPGPPARRHPTQRLQDRPRPAVVHHLLRPAQAGRRDAGLRGDGLRGRRQRLEPAALGVAAGDERLVAAAVPARRGAAVLRRRLRRAALARGDHRLEQVGEQRHGRGAAPGGARPGVAGLRQGHRHVQLGRRAPDGADLRHQRLGDHAGQRRQRRRLEQPGGLPRRPRDAVRAIRRRQLGQLRQQPEHDPLRTGRRGEGRPPGSATPATAATRSSGPSSSASSAPAASTRCCCGTPASSTA